MTRAERELLLKGQDVHESRRAIIEEIINWAAKLVEEPIASIEADAWLSNHHRRLSRYLENRATYEELKKGTKGGGE